MSMYQPSTIPVDDKLEEYYEFLQDNKSSLFSARFGDGKSYFLTKFKEKYNNDFLFITIYPINYQIEDNKDIIELIKRDILIQLITNGNLELTEKDYSNMEYFYSYISCNKGNLFIDLISSMFTLKYPLAESFISTIKKHYKEFIKYKGKTSFAESKMVENFIELQNKFIYEFDPISEIIYNTIEKVKKNDKKVILLIEDLDRIDPKHIFRIMNVFSAHFDHNFSSQSKYHMRGENKFGFDNLVVVCHYENMKNIFHHFYGENTDFTRL